MSTTRFVSLTAAIVVAFPIAAQQPVTRDSAGIRIVENRSRSTAPLLYRIGATPLFNVGGTENDPASEFNHNDGYIRGVPLSNGGYAVADVSRVQFFDGRSARLRISGTKGRGPLELLYMTNICVTRGDTVLVTDTQNNRLAVLDQRGVIVRTLPRPMSTYLNWNSCLSDGTFVMSRTDVATAAGQPDNISLIRMRLDGSIVNNIGPISAPLPGTIAGGVQYTAGRDRIYVSRGVDNQIIVFTPAGALTGIIRTADPLKPLSADETTRRTNTARTNATRTGRPLAAIPTHHQPYDELIIGADGWLWALEHVSAVRQGATWIAFDANGSLAAKVTLAPTAPDGDTPIVLGFGKGTITVRRWDSDGATFVSVYPLERVSGEQRN